MNSILNLIEQVRAVLIQCDDNKPKHEIYNQFINECKEHRLTEDDFYKRILKIAHKSIDWNYIEEEKKRKLEEQKKFEAEIAEREKSNLSAPIYLDRLIKVAFEDGIVEAEELKTIFGKAGAISFDCFTLAEKINSLLEAENYKSFPKADLSSSTLQETLCSSNWYDEKKYHELSTERISHVSFFKTKYVVAFLTLISLVLLFWFISGLAGERGSTESSQSDNIKDTRDGQKYKTIKIGNQVWMAENLSFKTKSGSWVYGNSETLDRRYGRLYTWEMAKLCCPNGWHLPSSAEWDMLIEFGGDKRFAGEKMKSASGWFGNGNGVNSSGFSGYPSGSRSLAGKFSQFGSDGFWWSSTENSSSSALILNLSFGSKSTYSYSKNKQEGYSVRCVRN